MYNIFDVHFYIQFFICSLFRILKLALFKNNICKNYGNYNSLNTMLSFFLVKKEVRTISANLLNYVNYESWKYCEKCDMVEPNNMLPNYGKQNLTYIRNCIWEKGRCFVPMVCIFYILYFGVFFLNKHSVILSHLLPITLVIS